MKKGYLTPPVLIIVAIIIFAVAILIVINTDLVKRLKSEPSQTPIPSPTPISDAGRELTGSTEIETWRTYTDDENSFQFMYPSDWKTEFFPATQVKNFSVWKPEDKDHVMPTIQVSVTNPFGKQPLEQIKEEYTFLFEEGNLVTTNIILGNKNAIKLQGKYKKPTENTDQYRSLIVTNLPNNYLIIWHHTATSEDLSNPTVHQILSTFRFD